MVLIASGRLTLRVKFSKGRFNLFEFPSGKNFILVQHEKCLKFSIYLNNFSVFRSRSKIKLLNL